MALKSYSSMFKKKSNSKPKKHKSSDVSNLIRQGGTAIIGVSLLGVTANAVSNI